MKRLVLSAAILAALSANCFAGLGVGLNGGFGQTKSGLDAHPNQGGRQNMPVFGGLEFLYEQSGLFDMGERHILGAKLGYTYWDSDTLVRDGGNYEISYYEIPLTLYYKYAPSKLHFGGGVGMAYAKTDDDTATVSKVYPFLMAAMEYRFCKLFGLGLDMRYNMGAKLEDGDGFVAKDISGIQGALAARFYF